MAPKIETIKIPEVKVPRDFERGGLSGSVKPDLMKITEVKIAGSEGTFLPPAPPVMKITPNFQSGVVKIFKPFDLTSQKILPERPLATRKNSSVLGPQGYFDLLEYRTFFHPSDEILQKNASRERFPLPRSERVEALRDQLKETLNRNPDWAKEMTHTDFSPLGVSISEGTFLEALNFEQLLILEVLLKIDAPSSKEKGTPGKFLWKLKNEGLLMDLLELKPESQRAFALMANMSAQKGQGRSFAERVFFDYLLSKKISANGRTTFSDPLFEKIFDPVTNEYRSRLDLSLEAYYWMEVAGVEGRREVLNGITSSYFDSYQNQWTDVKGPSEWRGNVDEAIRIGQQARENSWRPFYGESLTSADVFLGELSYSLGGGRKTVLLNPDGLRRDRWIEEYKSTYDDGKPAVFSFGHMTNKISFRNQVEKYGEAVRQGKIEGVVYRFTAKTVDPEVIEFIRDNIPNVQIFRYDSIADTQGVLMLDQAKNTKPFSSEVWKEAWKRAQTQGIPFFIEDGKLRSYLKPQGVICTVRAEEIKQELLLYTETIPALNQGRLFGRARVQIQWLVDLYDGLDLAGQARFERDLKRWTRDLDKGLLQRGTEEAQVKLIAEEIDQLARWVIARELPVVEEVSLGFSKYRPVLDEIPGRFKIYHRGEFGSAGPTHRLMVRKGMRVYLDSLSPHEVALSFSGGAGLKGSAEKKKNSSPSPQTFVLGLEADWNLDINSHFVRRRDENGHIYYEATEDVVFNNRGGTKEFEMSYAGENPLIDLYPPDQKRAVN